MSPETKPENSPEAKTDATADQADTNGSSPASITPTQEDLEARLKEQESKYAYLYADFENYKKRTIKERADLLKYGWESAARELLQVIDNLERAIAHVPAETDKALLQGLEMVHAQFKSTLEKQGVRPLETVGKPFDPNFEEAVAQEPSKEPAGTIIREHTRGYTLHGRLLRAARVVVSSGPAEG